jgi:hypothetical protein
MPQELASPIGGFRVAMIGGRGELLALDKVQVFG